MRTFNPQSVIKRLTRTSLTHPHSHYYTINAPFKRVTSRFIAAPPSSSKVQRTPPRLHNTQRSANIHANLRQQRSRYQQQPSGVVVNNPHPPQHYQPLLNFPYRCLSSSSSSSLYGYPPTTGVVLLPNHPTPTKPRMASTSVPDPSPASTSAAPGSSQPLGPTNQTPSSCAGASADNVLQQPHAQNRNYSSVSEEDVDLKADAATVTTEVNYHRQQEQGQQQPTREKNRVDGENKDPAHPIPALPAPGEGEEGALASGMKTLEVDGKAVALDNLGPMVVGRDGTISRISNWGEMTEHERRTTLRILCKRNQVRLAALRGEDDDNKQ